MSGVGLRVGVTGPTGFVGGHVLAAAVARGLEVSALSRRPFAAPGTVDVRLVGDLGAGPVRGEALRDLDVLIHLAARVHVMRDAAPDPLAAHRRVNTAGSVSLAKAAYELGVRRIVYVSSIKVNGEATPWDPARGGVPFTEASVPAPVDPYGQSKLEAELALRRLADEQGRELVVIRPPLVYGPGAGGNFRRLAGLVSRGVPLPLGAVDNRRSLVAVQNLADLLLLAARHPAAPGHVFLAGDGEDLSTAGLVRLIGKALGKPARLLPVPAGLLRLAGRATGRAAEVERLVGSLQVDASLARATLGWIPPLGPAEAIRLAVADGPPAPLRPG